ncbi:MAG: hypothetical protein AAB631_01340 [Patescibacteria group bacterium]
MVALSSSQEKKIFVDIKDDVAMVVDKVIHMLAPRIVIVLPENSAVGSSLKNFQVLSRESKTAGKEIVIESSDEHALELATLAELKILHSSLLRKKEKSVSDIVFRAGLPKRVPQRAAANVETEEIKPEKTVPLKPAPRKKEKESMPTPAFWEKSKETPQSGKTIYPVFPPELQTALGGEITFPKKEPEEFTRPHRSWRKWAVIGGGIVVLVALFWFLGFRVLPRAEITVTLKKTPVEFEETAQISTKVSTPQLGSPLVVPGQLMVKRGNLTETFPASGKENVATKAKGVLAVYNAYSSAPQAIVQNTRFLSPEGRLFRLDVKTTIPGAKIENGKIVPSSIDVTVTADAAGDTYNVKASAGWHIPGFDGTPKYAAFYAEAKSSMKGGFVGMRSVATAADTAAAKVKIEKDLEVALQSQMILLQQLKLIDGASSFKILSEDVEPDAQDATKMSIFAEGELKYLVFDETTLKNAIVQKAKEKVRGQLDDNLRVRSFDFSYLNSQPNLEQGTLATGMKGTVVFEPDVSEEGIKAALLGKTNDAFKGYVLSIKGLEKAKLTLDPFWVFSIPTDPAKVTVVLE